MKEKNILKLIDNLSSFKEKLLTDLGDLGELFAITFKNKAELYENLAKGLFKYGAVFVCLVDIKGKVVFSYPKSNARSSLLIVNPEATLLKIKSLFNLQNADYMLKEPLGCKKDLFCIVVFSKKVKSHELPLANILIKHFNSLLCFSYANDKQQRIISAALKLLYNLDKDTYMHSYRVKLYAFEIAKIFGLGERSLGKIKTASMLHDFGKLFIPVDILKKPGKLTRMEFEIVKRHSMRGYEYLKLFGIEDEEILEIVKYHHEKLDSSGYPEGRTDLSNLCWIVQSADILDAIQSSRSYKNSLGVKFLVDEIEGLRGLLPDNVIDVTLKFIRSDRFYLCRKRIKDKKGVIGQSIGSLGNHEAINQLKDENMGLKREIDLYKKIIQKEVKIIESFRDALKKNNNKIEFILFNTLASLGKLKGVIVLEGNNIVSIHKAPISIDIIKCCVDGCTNASFNNKEMFFEHFMTKNGRNVCAIFEDSKANITPSANILISSLTL